MALGFLYGSGGGSSIPEGATVTPVGDVYTWQRCAGIDRPQYTTLAELLADATTLAHVIDNANATDYLVRSKTWINNETKVPTMTSDTTPSGECFGDTVYASGYSYWKVFDRDESSMWSSQNAAFPHYVGYDFGTGTIITSVAITSFGNANACRAKNFKIQGYDGSSWDDLYTGIMANSSSKQYFPFSNTTAYSKYRLYVTDSYDTSSNICSIKELEFFSASIVLSQTAMALIGANNYASDTLLADSDWCEAICESSYFGSVLNDTVPAMTSATTPSGSVTASNYATGNDPYKAFDGSASTLWNTQDSTTAVTRTITYAFAGTCKAFVTTFEVRNSSDLPYSPSSVTVMGSNDNSNWTTLTTFNISDVSNKSIIPTPAAYKYYRCDCVAKLYSASNKYMCRAARIQFYGRQDV